MSVETRFEHYRKMVGDKTAGSDVSNFKDAEMYRYLRRHFHIEELLNCAPSQVTGTLSKLIEEEDRHASAT